MTMTDALRVMLHGDDEHTVVALQGELSTESAAFFRDVVEQLLAQPEGAGRIELHLEELEHCDAAGAELLAQLGRAATNAGRVIVTVHPSPAVRRAMAARR